MPNDRKARFRFLIAHLLVSLPRTHRISRQLVAGHPFLRDIVRLGGVSVEARIAAGMLELALVVPAMERWLAAIDTGAVSNDQCPLGQWLRGEKGRIIFGLPATICIRPPRPLRAASVSSKTGCRCKRTCG